MKRNVGGMDRRLRVLGGIALLAYALRATGFKRVAALVAGADLLLTAAVQRCPMNTLFGIDTCGFSERSEPGW